MKDNLNWIDPGLSKEVCNSLSQKGLIYGCGKQFIVKTKNKLEYIVEKCNEKK